MFEVYILNLPLMPYSLILILFVYIWFGLTYLFSIPSQASLSVVFQLINDDVSCDPRKRFEIDNFDLIIDVRSPNEFKEDHIPNAINMPVLDDDERCRVGTIYSNDPR